MGFLNLILIAIALSLDAFAVAISCGIKLRTKDFKKYAKISSSFGLFQAFMPLLGFSLGFFIKDFFQVFSSWIAFAVFITLGLKTLSEVFRKPKQESCEACTCDNTACLLGLSLATSIDALIIGFVLALYDVSILLFMVIVAPITFSITFLGNYLGHKASGWLGKNALVLAAIILIILAIKSVIK